MKHKLSTAAIAAIALVLFAPPAFSAPPPTASTPSADLDLVPHEVLVEFRSGAAPADLVAQIPGLQLRPIGADLGIARLVPSGATLYADAEARAATMRLLDRVRRHPAVARAQPNHRFQLSQQQTIPNDPLFPYQWHYPAIRLPEAWAFAQGGSSAVKIAIFDNGKSAHPELDGRWWSQEYNATNSTTANNTHAWQHAMHVAGIAGAATGNATGGAGACHNCTLVNVRVAIGNSVSTDSVLKGLTWAVERDIDVVNMSFEFAMACSHPDMSILRSRIMKAIDRNVAIVAAAGNAGLDVAGTSPASCPGVISVAASDPANRLAVYSNRGASLGIVAPGGGGEILLDQNGNTSPNSSIYGQTIGTPACPNAFGHYFNPYTHGAVSTWVVRGATIHTPCYRYLSGTSMAAPHVSGTVGLMLSAAPAMTPAQVLSILQSTARPMPGCGSDCGPGLLDAFAAVAAACARNIACPY